MSSSLDNASLSVVQGPRSGERFELDDSAPVVVGRSRMAAIHIDADGLSREHFEIWREGRHWKIRDLDSRNGLLVNRRPVREAPLEPGDEIQAGETRLRFDLQPGRRRFVEELPVSVADTPATITGTPDELRTAAFPVPVYDHVDPTFADARPPLADGTLAAALVKSCVNPSRGRMFALIDGAQAFELAFTARLMGSRLYTLFAGKLAVDLAHVGPCLVELPKPEAFLETWAGAIGTHAGVLFESAADLPAIYAHLRGLFLATDEDGQRYFFRFYDPRVLRAFLPTCTQAELVEFFGPLSAWTVENADTRTYTRYGIAPSGLTTQTIAEQ